MLYTGYFRSIDTTVDPKGQLYKVEIFTDGTTYTFRPVIGDDRAILVPTWENITLSDKPFTVEYGGDRNIYKPYRGSGATIGLVSGQMEFVNVGKCKNLVRLLKYKNEVELNGDTYTNTETGETLSKKRMQITRFGIIQTVFYDFVPSLEDEFCYDVEWVGYVTPNVHSQDYTKIFDEYELECQDVLTTLKYFDYPTNEDGVNTIIKSIFECLNVLPNNQINNVLVTNTLSQSILASSPLNNVQSIAEMLKTVNDNWVDEDGNWTDCLTVLENIMLYLNATIIQWKDKFYVTTPDAIKGGYRYYQQFRDYINGSYEKDQNVLVGHTFDIATSELANANTKVSTSNTYKDVTVSTDEYYDDNLSIDLSDNNEDLDEVGTWETVGKSYMKVEEVDREYSSSNPYRYGIVNKNAIFSGSILQHNPDTTKNHATVTTYCYNKNTADDVNYFKQKQYHTVISNPTTWNEMFNRAGCSIVDFEATEIDPATGLSQYYKSYHGQRCFLFHTANSFWDDTDRFDNYIYIVPLIVNSGTITTANQDNNRMLKIVTKKCFMKRGQSLQLDGDLMFYQNNALPLEAGWAVDELKAYKPFMFIWCKIYINVNGTTYYMKNTDTTVSGSYTWDTTDGWCKIWYDNFAGLDPDLKKRNRQTTTVYAFENLFSFTKNTRGADGTCVELPAALGDGIYSDITIEIARPFGCGREKRIADHGEMIYPASYTILSDFYVNVVDTQETNYRYKDNTNNEFKGKADEYAVDAFEPIKILVSSDYYKNTSKASVLGLHDRLNNIASGSNSLPEANIINNVIRTYKDSRVTMNIALPTEITPFDLITWTTQMQDKKFVVNSLNIDYAYNAYELDLFEKTLSGFRPSILAYKKTRNFRRNGDNLYSPLPAMNKRELQDPTEPPIRLDPTFNIDRIGNAYVDYTLMRDMRYEPRIEEGELVVSMPDYLLANATIDENGYLKIDY